jgi:hypothetical protein
MSFCKQRDSNVRRFGSGAFNERGRGLSRILCECRGIAKAEVHNLMMRGTATWRQMASPDRRLQTH